MTMRKIITNIEQLSNYIVHTMEIRPINKLDALVIIDYWRSIGVTNEAIGYCKKYIVKNRNTQDEIVYEDKATPSQTVRARIF